VMNVRVIRDKLLHLFVSVERSVEVDSLLWTINFKKFREGTSSN